MTVKELIEILFRCDDDATIRIRCCPNGVEDGSEIEVNAIHVDRLVRITPEPEGHGTVNECCIISG